MKFPIAREGYPFIAFFFILFALSLVLNSVWYSVPLGCLTLFMGAFFRDPERPVRYVKDTVYSPADGVVTGVYQVFIDGKPFYQVVVFLSVFNCHINRVPFSGKVISTTHIAGKFLAAFRKDIDKKNERQITDFETEHGIIRVVQITGALARRIVCRLKPRVSVATGNRFGLIKFGSRTDLYVSQKAMVLVKKGQKVKGGITPFAQF